MAVTERFVVRSDITGEYLTGMKEKQVKWVDKIEDARLFPTAKSVTTSLENRKYMVVVSPRLYL